MTSVCHVHMHACIYTYMKYKMLISYDFPPNPYCYLPYSSFPFSLYFPPVNLPNYLLHYFSHSSLCSICVLKFLFLLSTNNFLQPVFELAGIFFSLKESSLKLAVMSSTYLAVFFSSRNCLVPRPPKILVYLVFLRQGSSTKG